MGVEARQKLLANKGVLMSLVRIWLRARSAAIPPKAWWKPRLLGCGSATFSDPHPLHAVRSWHWSRSTVATCGPPARQTSTNCESVKPLQRTLVQLLVEEQGWAAEWQLLLAVLVIQKETCFSFSPSLPWHRGRDSFSLRSVAKT